MKHIPMITLDHQGSGASVSQIKFPVVLMKVNCNTSFTPKLVFSAHHDALFVFGSDSAAATAPAAASPSVAAKAAGVAAEAAGVAAMAAASPASSSTASLCTGSVSQIFRRRCRWPHPARRSPRRQVAMAAHTQPQTEPHTSCRHLWTHA